MSLDFTTLSYRPLTAAIVDIFKSGAFRSVYVEGMPGIGKTAMGKPIQERMGLAHRFMIKPGHHENIDFHGLPVPNHTDHTTEMYPSACLLPASDLKGGVLLIGDELPDSATMVQNLWCQLMFEGGLHNYVLPENTYILNTGNRVADRSGANRIVTKLANRCARFTLEPTVQELFDYGATMGWAPSVLAFLKLRGDDPINPNDKKASTSGYRPTYFNSFDPADPAQSVKSIFASSRTWEATSTLTNWIDINNPRISDPELLCRVASMLGGSVGKNVPYPKKNGVMWVLTISLVSKATKLNFENIYNWLAGSNNREFAILFIKQCFTLKAAALISPVFNKVLQLPDVKQAMASV